MVLVDGVQEYTGIIHWYVVSAFRVGEEARVQTRRKGNIMIMPGDAFVT